MIMFKLSSEKNSSPTASHNIPSGVRLQTVGDSNRYAMSNHPHRRRHQPLQSEVAAAKLQQWTEISGLGARAALAVRV